MQRPRPVAAAEVPVAAGVGKQVEGRREPRSYFVGVPAKHVLENVAYGNNTKSLGDGEARNVCSRV